MHLGQNSKVVETKPQYNADSGKVERSYITESGNEYEERGGADLEQNAIDEARFQSEQQEAYLLREKQRIEQEMNQRGRELDAEAVDFSWRDMPRGSGGAIHTYNSSTVNGRLADTKYKSLLAQLNKVNDGLATLAVCLERRQQRGHDQCRHVSVHAHPVPAVPQEHAAGEVSVQYPRLLLSVGNGSWTHPASDGTALHL